ncbi:MAG: HIT domain-containing protein [Xanthomonadales bacterium]|nr:HIT domain-containing protein [Xanthomonadales bacterium]
MNEPFELDARLAGDTHFIGDLALSRVLLMDDARWPWLILVPRRAGLRELVDLEVDAQYVLLDEINRTARLLQHLHAPDKLNIAALGNVVAQLHVHVIARHHQDAAWPSPVWGRGERVAYAPNAARRAIGALAAHLGC